MLFSMTPGPVLPRMPRHFCGREEAINAVVTTIIDRTPGRVAILGSAGICLFFTFQTLVRLFHHRHRKDERRFDGVVRSPSR